METVLIDSNETARTIASGGFLRKPTGRIVTIAASGFIGSADYYCDGTSDEVEINNALTILSVTGGGTVHLTGGVFNTGAAINIAASGQLEGEGQQTIIASSATDYAIESVGTYGSHISMVTIQNLQIKSPKGTAIYFSYCDDFWIQNIYVYDWGTNDNINYDQGIDFDNCNNGIVIGCVLDGNSRAHAHSTAALIANSTCKIISNTIRNVKSSILAYGIECSAGSGSIIAQNTIDTITCTAGGGAYSFGIDILQTYCQVINNSISNVTNTGSAQAGVGIQADGNGNSNESAIINNKVVSCGRGIDILSGATRVTVQANYCYGNGSDSGVSNTNGHNFRDNGTDTMWAG